MENASKAILIAGGILITLVVVSIIMIIFNKGRAFNQEQIDNFDDKIIAYHNSQFTSYERDLSKSEFEKLINLVIKSNKSAKQNEYIVSIVYNNVNYTYNSQHKTLINSGNDIKNLKFDSLDEFSCYTVANSYGIISVIYVNKK